MLLINKIQANFNQGNIIFIKIILCHIQKNISLNSKKIKNIKKNISAAKFITLLLNNSLTYFRILLWIALSNAAQQRRLRKYPLNRIRLKFFENAAGIHLTIQLFHEFFHGQFV